jgi:hypothetical protein
MVMMGFDEHAKTVLLPPGFTARKSVFPSQIDVHIGPGRFVSLPMGWTALAPVVGAETMP